jgi:RiboL-PSP-HEPN
MSQPIETNINTIFDNWKTHIDSLKSDFIDTISSTSILPSISDNNLVRAFVVLFHASLEEYFENIASAGGLKAVKAYQTHIYVDAPDLADLNKLNAKIGSLIETYVLFAFTSLAGEIKKDEINLKKLIEDLEDVSKYNKNTFTSNTLNKLNTVSAWTTNILSQANTQLQNKTKSNLGVTFRYLIDMLLPIGIDLNSSAKTPLLKIKMFESLRKLAYWRGEYAHKAIKINIGTPMPILGKTDLDEMLTDCTELCEFVRDLINSKFS